MSEKLFVFPVPHIHEDGSVSQLNVSAWEPDSETSQNDFICVEDDTDSILISSPEQARQLARALEIAARKKWG